MCMNSENMPPDEITQVGKLMDLDWKLGLSTSSSHCRGLNAGFVTMVIKVADASGKIKSRSFELTIPEFQKFSSQMKEMASAIDNV